MKAIVYTKYGSPDVLKLKDRDKPVPKNDEVFINVKASSVNRTDCANLRAKPFIMRLTMGLLKPKKQILGTEFAGEVDFVGKDVTGFKVGERVFGFDDGGLCSYAEYMVISENNSLAVIPEEFTYLQAAGCIEGFHYAYNFINKVNLMPGQKVLVNGASGGIGSATVQLLKYYGAEITGVCDTKNIDLVKSLGAKKTIDYTQQDFTEDTEKYNYVFDSVGKSSFGKCKHLLLPGGSYISSELGWMAQNVFYALTTAIFGSLPLQSKKQVKFPYPPDRLRSITLLKKLIVQGKFKSVIDRIYPMHQIPDAFRYVEKGQKTGNVVISI